MYTSTFFKIADAYAKGYGFIESRGGTRSSKTYSKLQLLDLIAQKPKKRVITTVGLSIPHLKGGAIRDYDNILNERGIIPDLIRTKDPYIYTYGNTIHEFISFDNLGKALGAARDILFLNEGNKMPWDIVHQLIQRTTECTFVDYNPSVKFWIDNPDQYDIQNRRDAFTVHSTFRDNYENLSETQKEEFRIGERKAKEEEARGVYGYWSNWWKVYGLGEYGQIEGAIYTDWEVGEFNDLLPYRFGLDFGFSCFEGNTLITTDKGYCKIKDIKIGDRVLTRNGFNKVLRVNKNGVKKVSDNIIGFDFGYINICCTFSHKFKTDKGWKQFKDLQKTDRLCLSANLMGKSTEDTQTESTRTTFIQKAVNGIFIEIFGEAYTVKSQKVNTFITLTAIRLITLLRTLCLSVAANIQESTTDLKNTTADLDTQKITGSKEGKKLLSALATKKGFVRVVILSLLQQIRTKFAVLQNAIIDTNIQIQNTTKSIFVKCAGVLLKGINILNKRLAQKDVPTFYQEVKEIKMGSEYLTEVFDLTVEDKHEYFANDILVHNCDPDALVKVAVDEKTKTIFMHECMYKNGQSFETLRTNIEAHCRRNDLIVADSAEDRLIYDLMAYYNIVPAKKWKVIERIKKMQSYHLVVTSTSTNLINELMNYVWSDKKSETPVDKANHLLDAAGYAVTGEPNQQPSRVLA